MPGNTDFALALTRAIDPELAAEPDLRYGFLLHDIGKIGVWTRFFSSGVR